MIGLHITTQGCKLNQFDSAELAGALRGAATLVPDPAGALLVIVNTCTVTGAADADARQALRRRRRESPRALIVATGCYAERDPEALRAMPEVDLVLTREERPRASRLILTLLHERFPDELADGCADRVAEETLPDFGERTRAFLRVQEGCDLSCSYCVIPQVRGASRSVPPVQLERRLGLLLDAGFREVVLTGVNTGDYGKDLTPREDLAGLLSRLARREGDFRIRLNSVEPRCVTPELVAVIADEPKVARHLQVPIQSGSDGVLRAMRRNYRTSHYARVMQMLRSRIPDVGIGADVIVGFPGEGEGEFGETVSFIRSMPINYLHVFPYSRRPGTPAALMPGQVPPPAVAERGRRLRALGGDLSRDFRRSQMARRLRALVLAGRRADGRARALTSNFIDLTLDADLPENAFADVVITRVEGSETVAVPAPVATTGS
ncbi:MAG TPA: tRNA (N(6)-L-threonylcarbamoyladenosine(37)-C(2))-methylthiotransferase MtaB [Candidatus Polarisedimenticolia bacterium]|jgi:threonylcarbamoyladenosine tRNA methylthiotransferase MtaB